MLEKIERKIRVQTRTIIFCAVTSAVNNEKRKLELMERQWRLMFMQPDLRACEHEGHRSRRQGSCKKLTLVKVAATQNLLFRKEINGNYI